MIRCGLILANSRLEKRLPQWQVQRQDDDDATVRRGKTRWGKARQGTDDARMHLSTTAAATCHLLRVRLLLARVQCKTCGQKGKHTQRERERKGERGRATHEQVSSSCCRCCCYCWLVHSTANRRTQSVRPPVPLSTRLGQDQCSLLTVYWTINCAVVQPRRNHDIIWIAPSRTFSKWQNVTIKSALTLQTGQRVC